MWTFIADMDGNYKITITDAKLWFSWLFFFPGDLIINWTCLIPYVGEFLEISPRNYSGWISGIMSFYFWLCSIEWISKKLNLI